MQMRTRIRHTTTTRNPMIPPTIPPTGVRFGPDVSFMAELLAVVTGEFDANVSLVVAGPLMLGIELGPVEDTPVGGTLWLRKSEPVAIEFWLGVTIELVMLGGNVEGPTVTTSGFGLVTVVVLVEGDGGMLGGAGGIGSCVSALE
jgi:hypothetical protein